MMAMYKVGYFVGSLSSTSINRELSKALVRVAPADLEFSEIPIRNLPLYSPDYDANYPPPEGEVIRAGLALFNDVITRAAFSRGLPLIDLRLICDEPGDYANPIEPSTQGGSKIAAAISRLIASGNLRNESSVVIAH